MLIGGPKEVKTIVGHKWSILINSIFGRSEIIDFFNERLNKINRNLN